MPKITFDPDELKHQLLFEVYKEEDGPNGPGFMRFGGFIRPEAIYEARVSRQSMSMCEAWYADRKQPVPMSVYLSFLAQVFAEIEMRNENQQLKTYAAGPACICGQRRAEDCKGPKDCDNHVGKMLPNFSPVEALRPTPPIEKHRCPRCGMQDTEPFEPGPSCRRQPCHGRGEI